MSIKKAGNGQKTARSWTRAKEGFSEFSIFFLHFRAIFWAIFAPVQLGGVFHLVFHFLPISGFWPFSMPYQPGMIPRKGGFSKEFSCRVQCHAHIGQVVAALTVLDLRSWRPSKEVPKPRPGKVPRKVPVRNGVPRGVPKKVLCVPSPTLPLHRCGARSTSFGTFLGTPFRTGTF